MRVAGGVVREMQLLYAIVNSPTEVKKDGRSLLEMNDFVLLIEGDGEQLPTWGNRREMRKNKERVIGPQYAGRILLSKYLGFFYRNPAEAFSGKRRDKSTMYCIVLYVLSDQVDEMSHVYPITAISSSNTMYHTHIN